MQLHLTEIPHWKFTDPGNEAMINRDFKVVFLLLLSMFLLVSDLYAGKNRSGYYWWRVPEIVSETGLTPDQVDKIENIFQTHKDKILETEEKIKEKEKELKKMLDNPASETNEVKILGKEVLNLKSERKSLKLDMLFGIRDVLDTEQRKILKELKNKHK